MTTIQSIINDPDFQIGRRVKFSHTVPELRKITKMGHIIAKYPYVIQVAGDDGKVYTLNKKDFHQNLVDVPTDVIKAFFI